MKRRGNTGSLFLLGSISDLMVVDVPKPALLCEQRTNSSVGVHNYSLYTKILWTGRTEARYAIFGGLCDNSLFIGFVTISQFVPTCRSLAFRSLRRRTCL